MNTQTNSNIKLVTNDKKSYTHLTLGERKRIKLEYDNGLSAHKIADILGRSHSTISREIKRNGRLNQPSIAAKRQKIKTYSYSFRNAEKKYIERRKKCKSKDKYSFFKNWLIKNHNYYLSFEQHLANFKKNNPDIITPTLKTIYNWFKNNILKMISNIRVKTYRKKYCYTKDKINRKSIHEREVNDYSTTGHYEIDTIYNSDKKGGLLTFNHRASMKLYSRIVTDRSAITINKALRDIIKEIGPENILSITSDNGREFYYNLVIENNYSLDWFYCDPFNSCQRGQNERLNRDIRKYYGKHFNFKSLKNDELQEIIDSINKEPRRKHNGLSANEVEKNLKR